MLSRSEYQLLQEEHLDDPWKVLLCCILLNQTRFQQVVPVLEALLDEWPNAAAMADAPEEDVEAIIASIGLKKRGGYIVEMSEGYMAKRPTKWADVLELAGCGRYAAEAWRMLVEKDHTFYPKDMRLRARMLWLRLGECSVIADTTNRIGIKLPGGDKGTPVITLDQSMTPGYTRTVQIIKPDEMRYWRVLEDKSPAQTAEKFLSSTSIRLDKGAEEAVMLLVLNEKGKFVGKFAAGSEDTIAKAAPEGSTTYSTVAGLASLTLAALLVALNSIVPKDDRLKKFDEAETVETAAEKVWAAAETKVVKVKEEKPARPLGDKEKLRGLLVAAGDQGMSIDEMSTGLGVEKKRCSDYLCYLKNPKYCGEHGVLNIVKAQGRFFDTAENAAAYEEANPVVVEASAAA